LDPFSLISLGFTLPVAWCLWRMVRQIEMGPVRSRRYVHWIIATGSGCLMVSGMAVPRVLEDVVNGPGQDSLFTLDPLPRAGLIALTVAFTCLLLAGVSLATRRIQTRFGAWIALDLALGAALLLTVVGLTLSTQIYYEYYLAVLPDLPRQWVISGPFELTRVVEISVYATRDSLAENLRGMVFWAALLMVPLHWAGSESDRRAAITFAVTLTIPLIASRVLG